MDAYIYQADVYCAACGVAIRERLKVEGRAPADPEDESSYDSDDFPKGPYANGGGEADYPQHCRGCDVFLQNPLTGEGYAYVRDGLADPATCVREWAEFYRNDFPPAATDGS